MSVFDRLFPSIERPKVLTGTEVGPFQVVGSESIPGTRTENPRVVDVVHVNGNTKDGSQSDEQVADVPRLQFYTSMKPEFSCAIGCFGMEGIDPGELSNTIFNKWKIHTTSIKWEDISAVRVTPNVYTTTAELDKLVKAIKDLA